MALYRSIWVVSEVSDFQGVIEVHEVRGVFDSADAAEAAVMDLDEKNAPMQHAAVRYPLNQLVGA